MQRYICRDEQLTDYIAGANFSERSVIVAVSSKTIKIFYSQMHLIISR